jgi:hypothetical protein
LPAVVSWFPEFSCHAPLEERINNGAVKALLLARGDFLPRARVGSWFVACLVLHEAKAAGLTTADFLQITAGGGDHVRQRQTEA